MAEHLRKFRSKAQEKTPVFRTEKRGNPKTGHAYPWIVKSTAMVNHYYIYAVDRDFGPVLQLLSVQCQVVPELLRIRQAAARAERHRLRGARHRYFKLRRPWAPAAICDGPSAEKIDGFLRKWLRLLPRAFTATDRKAGYCYDISILQAEFSLTQVIDRPVQGRLFFEQVIRENLDLGRPKRCG
jgi:hypothetical protein